MIDINELATVLPGTEFSRVKRCPAAADCAPVETAVIVLQSNCWKLGDAVNCVFVCVCVPVCVRMRLPVETLRRKWPTASQGCACPAMTPDIISTPEHTRAHTHTPTGSCLHGSKGIEPSTDSMLLKADDPWLEVACLLTLSFLRHYCCCVWKSPD